MRIELTKGAQSVRSVEQGRDNLLYARCVRIAPKPSRRGWGGNTRISGKVVVGQRDGNTKGCLMFCLNTIPVYKKWS